MNEILLSYAPMLLLFVVLLILLRYRIRAGAEAQQKLQDRMQEQLELGQRNTALIEQQIAQLKRIADALERRP